MAEKLVMEVQKLAVLIPVAEEFWDTYGDSLIESLTRDAKREMEKLGRVVSEIEHTVSRPARIDGSYLPLWETEDIVAPPMVALRFTALAILHEEV